MEHRTRETVMSNRPQVGEKVKIESRDLSRVEGWPKNRTSTFEGVVVPTFSWLDPSSICISSDDPKIPVRSFNIQNVVKITRENGSESKPAPPQKEESKSWTVNGSKGAVYVVIKNGTRWGCNCVAGQFNRACKHVREIQEQNK